MLLLLLFLGTRKMEGTLLRMLNCEQKLGNHPPRKRRPLTPHTTAENALKRKTEYVKHNRSVTIHAKIAGDRTTTMRTRDPRR